MADVEISYKGSTIAQMDSGTKTLRTGGCYCEGDVVVTYTPRADDSFRHWDVTVTGAISGSLADILQDDWLKAHRSDENLCVAVIPRFPIPFDSTVANQGVWLCTNSAILTDSAGEQYHSLSAYIHKNGSIICRARKPGVTNPNDIGDLNISTSGKLQAVALEGGYPLVPGEYCVTAWLM